MTDGDIRRALISKLGLSSKVEELMNDSPITTQSPYSREKLLQQMSQKDILHMPIIGSDGSLCGLETLQNLIEKPTYNNPAKKPPSAKNQRKSE